MSAMVALKSDISDLICSASCKLRADIILRDGMMREDYLKQHNPGLWNRLMLCGELTEHLNEIDKTARERIERMMPELMKSAGVTEEPKRMNPLKWVGLVNACKSQAEEIVFAELVYC